MLWPYDDELSHIRWKLGKEGVGTLMQCNTSRTFWR
jgi:hypothetical protein